MTPRKYPGQAVVVVGSLAGLFAARVLSDRFDSVLVLERDELENTAAGRRGVPQGRHAHALRMKYSSHLRTPVCSRPFLEEAVRGRVEKIENIELRTGTHAENLHAAADRSRVTGVVFEDGTVIDAALTLDCTGRSGRTVPWLEALGYAPPEVTGVTPSMARACPRPPNRRTRSRRFSTRTTPSTQT